MYKAYVKKMFACPKVYVSLFMSQSVHMIVYVPKYVGLNMS